jgi:hypothetical protein
MPFTFPSESAFRDWICTELGKLLPPEEWYMVKGKNVADILVSWQHEENPVLIFLEVKYHKKIHGRTGFGNHKGEGYQVEYLMNKMTYLEKHLRWVVGDEASDSALILTNEEVRQYAAGGVIRPGKQNNLHSALFRKEQRNAVPMADLPRKLADIVQQMVKVG